jgi:serine/threonine protein kinase
MGLNLYEKIKKQKFTFLQVLKIATNICQAVKDLHQVGIIHRDLKPENFVEHEELGHYVVIDLGSAAFHR